MTRTETPSATPFVSRQRASCVGDCNGDDDVTVPEIVTGVNIALDRAELEACPAFACNGSNVALFVNCGVLAVRNALSGCPKPTPLATPTPTPVFAVVYELAEGSTILVSSPRPGSLPMAEPLSGTFVVKVDCGSPLECLPVRGPNTLFAMTITNIAFQSPHLSVGGTGSIGALSFYPEQAFAGGRLIIADEAFPAGGLGTIDRHFPPSFSGLDICGGDTTPPPSCEAIRAGTEAGYALRLFAVPRR